MTNDSVQNQSSSSSIMNPVMNQNSVGSNLNKFKLPHFNNADPVNWFLSVDFIFAQNGVDTEAGKFSALLQHLENEQLRHIYSVIQSERDDKYTEAREKLTKALGKSMEEQLDMLVRGAGVSQETKPSLILQLMQNSGLFVNNDKLLRGMWLQRLPISSQQILGMNQSLSLTQTAEMADYLYTIEKTRGTPQVHAIQSSISNPNLPQNTGNNTNQYLVTVISKLTEQVAALEARFNEFNVSAVENRRSHTRPSRNRSPTPNFRHSRSHSRQRNQLYNGLCWYHFQFGDKANKCYGGCKLSSSSSTSSNQGNE